MAATHPVAKSIGDLCSPLHGCLLASLCRHCWSRWILGPLAQGTWVCVAMFDALLQLWFRLVCLCWRLCSHVEGAIADCSPLLWFATMHQGRLSLPSHTWRTTPGVVAPELSPRIQGASAFFLACMAEIVQASLAIARSLGTFFHITFLQSQGMLFYWDDGHLPRAKHLIRAHWAEFSCCTALVDRG